MTEIRATDYFAIIPEAVLFADISANAVRLYAVLNRYANSRGHAWPSRKTIAERMAVSVATVDRAKDELVAIGALTVEPRTTPAGDPASNLYVLHSTPRPPGGTLSPVTQGTVTREGTRMVTGDALNRDIMNQNQNTGSSRALACGHCLGKHRAGYDDGTEGLSHVWNAQARSYELCPVCSGSGKRP